MEQNVSLSLSEPGGSVFAMTTRELIRNVGALLIPRADCREDGGGGRRGGAADPEPFIRHACLIKRQINEAEGLSSCLFLCVFVSGWRGIARAVLLADFARCLCVQRPDVEGNWVNSGFSVLLVFLPPPSLVSGWRRPAAMLAVDDTYRVRDGPL